MLADQSESSGGISYATLAYLELLFSGLHFHEVIRDARLGVQEPEFLVSSD
jgi:hypothetical protein